MTADTIIRNTCCDPVSAFLSGTFANHVHDPYLVRVGDGEGLPFGRVAVLFHERHHAVDCLSGSLTALQSDVHQAAVIDAYRVPQLLAATPGRLAYRQLVLVHVAHHVIRMCHLRNESLRTVTVPVAHLAHTACRMICRRTIMQKAVQRVTVRSIRKNR